MDVADDKARYSPIFRFKKTRESTTLTRLFCEDWRFRVSPRLRLDTLDCHNVKNVKSLIGTLVFHN